MRRREPPLPFRPRGVIKAEGTDRRQGDRGQAAHGALASGSGQAPPPQDRESQFPYLPGGPLGSRTDADRPYQAPATSREGREDRDSAIHQRFNRCGGPGPVDGRSQEKGVVGCRRFDEPGRVVRPRAAPAVDAGEAILAESSLRSRRRRMSACAPAAAAVAKARRVRSSALPSGRSEATMPRSRTNHPPF